MNKSLLISVTLILSIISVSGQPCPDSLYITSQAQVDSFQINYPGCTEIEGKVYIWGNDIVNLNGLSALTSIGGFLGLYDNDSLTSLTGLNNVSAIGGYLWVFGNGALISLTGLENVSSIGGLLYFAQNNALTNLMGLENIENNSIEDLM